MNSNVHCTPSLFKILTKSLYLLTEIGVGEHKRPEVWSVTTPWNQYFIGQCEVLLGANARPRLVIGSTRRIPVGLMTDLACCPAVFIYLFTYILTYLIVIILYYCMSTVLKGSFLNSAFDNKSIINRESVHLDLQCYHSPQLWLRFGTLLSHHCTEDGEEVAWWSREGKARQEESPLNISSEM